MVKLTTMIKPSEVYTITKAPCYHGQSQQYEFRNNLEGGEASLLTKTSILRRLSKDLYPDERKQSDNPKCFIYTSPTPVDIRPSSKVLYTKGTGVHRVFTILTEGLRYDKGSNKNLVEIKCDPGYLDENRRIRSYIAAYSEGLTKQKETRVSKKMMRLLQEENERLKSENEKLKSELELLK